MMPGTRRYESKYSLIKFIMAIHLKSFTAQPPDRCYLLQLPGLGCAQEDSHSASSLQNSNHAAVQNVNSWRNRDGRMSYAKVKLINNREPFKYEQILANAFNTYTLRFVFWADIYISYWRPTERMGRSGCRKQYSNLQGSLLLLI